MTCDCCRCHCSAFPHISMIRRSYIVDSASKGSDTVHWNGQVELRWDLEVLGIYVHLVSLNSSDAEILLYILEMRNLWTSARLPCCQYGHCFDVRKSFQPPPLTHNLCRWYTVLG
ncbi:hypothetical protein PVAP13_2NG415200 [Panicum virgatum]|uniref:Uncharacterized protein n=1 Tax=Panicum virgatum TaxID=38727 RepID=A0A8T0VKE0_PANVG|nr:hypothetical protein PVAP13_2NG415200 [Panicum virgatum]